MKAMVLAAGFGTRFRPVTRILPKPLVPVCNLPVIAWIIDDLRAQGVDEVVVNVHHHGDQIASFLDQRYADTLRIHVSREERILGTGGGIARARSLLVGERPFLVVNGDTIQNLPVERMLRCLDEAPVVASMLLREQRSDDRYTPVEVEGDRVTRIGGERGSRPLMFAGCHAMAPSIFGSFPERDVFDIVSDVYASTLVATGRVGATIASEGSWHDLGTPASYMRAVGTLRDEMIRGIRQIPVGSTSAEEDSVIAGTARIEGALERCVAGDGVTIGPGSRLHETVLWDRARIGRNVDVSSSIVTMDVEVPDGARIENAIIVPGAEEADHDGPVARVGSALAMPLREDRVMRAEA